MRFPAIVLALLLALAFLAYYPGLSGPFLLDDQVNLESLAALEVNPKDWPHYVFSNGSGHLHRPVAVLTFIGNVLISGLDPWAFKLTNLILHLLIGVLVWVVARQIFALKVDDPTTSSWLGLLVSALWLFSPLLASTVLYPVQRMAQLSALFSLAALWVYLKWRPMIEEWPTKKFAGWAAVVGLFVLLSVFSKENGFLTPYILLLTEIVFFRFQGKGLIRRRLGIFFVCFALLPAVAAVIAMIHSPDRFLSYATRNFNMGERLMTEARVLWQYIFGLLIPQSHLFGVYHDSYEISRSLFKPFTTFIAVSSLLMALLLVFILLTRRRLIIGAYGLAFFFLAHALESTIFPLEIYFEHRNYLPSVGIYLAAVYFAYRLFGKFQSIRKLGSLFAGLLVVAFFIATLQRSLTWSSLDTLLLSAAEAQPNSIRVHVDLMQTRIDRGDLEGAQKVLSDLVKLAKPDIAPPLMQFLGIYCVIGRHPPSELYDRIASAGPGRRMVYLANVIDRLNQLQRKYGCDVVDWKKLSDIYASWYEQYDGNSTPGEKQSLSRTVEIRFAENFLYNGRWDLSYEILHDMYAQNQNVENDIKLLLVQAALASGKIDVAEQLLNDVNSRRRELTTELAMTLDHLRSITRRVKNEVNALSEGGH